VSPGAVPRLDLLGLLAALLLGACASPGTSGDATRRGLPKVVLVGIDGATFRVLDPLLQAGRLPHFRTLIRTGARGAMRSEAPLQSPPIWTTVGCAPLDR
jgi:hypothetical protein